MALALLPVAASAQDLPVQSGSDSEFIERDDVIVCAGLNNGSGTAVPALLAGAFNAYVIRRAERPLKDDGEDRGNGSPAAE